MKKITIVISILALAACSNNKGNVLGVESGGEYYSLDHAAKAAVAKNNDDERLVCKRVQKTGSHFKTKRCTTVAELKAEKRRAKEILEERQLQETRRMVREKNN
ncbi:hypothetical protein [Marinicella rhabdoformis]|uniref:hypothetical protein n=1 Tax=Marinicella rhabdoformis TaxID=2580566 RepID=UPI0012AEB2D0|nr:hypothetical protein [Marinicella rhabdoformis]